MKVELNVMLNSIDKVKAFANCAMQATKTQITIKSNRLNSVIDAKSVLGLFSLNLLQPMHCTIVGNSETEIDCFYKSLVYYGIV